VRGLASRRWPPVPRSEASGAGSEARERACSVLSGGEGRLSTAGGFCLDRAGQEWYPVRLQSRFKGIKTSVTEPHGEERAPAGRRAGLFPRLLIIATDQRSCCL